MIVADTAATAAVAEIDVVAAVGTVAGVGIDKVKSVATAVESDLVVVVEVMLADLATAVLPVMCWE